MSTPRIPPGLQPERTRLAWQRTAIAMAVGSLVYARVEADVLGLAGWACALVGSASGILIGIRSSHRYRHTCRQLETDDARLADGLLPLVAATVVTAAGVVAVVVTALAGPRV